MRARLSLGLLLAVTLIAIAPRGAAAAPEGRHWTFTPVAGWAQYSDKLQFPIKDLQDQFGAGARLGLGLNEWWAIEASGFWSPAKEDSTDSNVPYLNLAGSLLYTPIRWKIGSPYFALGGGYMQRNPSDYDGLDDLHHGTFEQAVGWNSWFTEKTALRLEARNVLNVPQKNWGQANKADQQYLAGLTFAFGGTPKDTDGDGVVDKKDKCPATPAGAKVDVNGCPLDSDGDGVFDGLDQCPDTPKGATVDANGCPTDSDGDGVFDGLDQCPSTPKGATVDANGCPKDSDSDGVPDGIDQCPNTAAGLKVDANGCPIEVTEKETELLDTGMIRLQNVNFETGKAELLEDSYAPLDEVGSILVKWPQLKIEIGGHTDARGTDAKNQVLSEARAESVKAYLTSRFSGIDASQLTTKGYGESKPLAKNTTALNMAKNRRVEFKVLNRDALKKEIERRKMLQK